MARISGVDIPKQKEELFPLHTFSVSVEVVPKIFWKPRRLKKIRK